MSPLLKGMVTVAAVVAAAGAGLWVGQTGLVKLPMPAMTAMTGMAQPDAKGPVIYYRDPDGKPLYSPTPKTTDGGRPYVAVYAGEDVGFDAPKPAASKPAGDAAQSQRKIIHYRNPMGLPDISPVPKKDSMGMDYIPVYEGDADEGGTVKVSPGKIQRTGVKTELVGKREIGRNIRAPGVVEIDERRVTVVAPRFDGFIETVGPVTSGTHVKKGAPLMTVFGQELLNQAARLLIEPSGQNDQSGSVIGARRRLAQLRRTRGVHRPDQARPGRSPTPSAGRPRAMASFSSATPSTARASRPGTCCSASPTIRWCGSWRMSPRATLARSSRASQSR